MQTCASGDIKHYINKMQKVNGVTLGAFRKKMVDENYETPIYRCIHFERLLEMLFDKKLVLPKTRMWEDPYENFLFKAKVEFCGLPTSLDGHIDSLYGQCWTMKKETDAIWRIYSPAKQSVIIKSRISKLVDVIGNAIPTNDSFDTLKRVIAPIKYSSKRTVHELIHQYSSNIFPNFEQAFSSLFIKRTEFKHEDEVRIVIQKTAQTEDDYYTNGERKFIQVNIEPNDFIEEILLDPRINDEQYHLYSNMFISAGYLGKIRKSKLYENFK